MKRTGLSWIAVAAVLVVGCSNTDRTKTAGSEPQGAVGTGGTARDGKSDREFVHDVAVMHMAEIELSRMALGKSLRPDVKTFAQQVIDEHGAAGDKLKGALGDSAIDWPVQVDDTHRKTAEDLAKKQGAEFDRDYVEAIVHGHQDLAAKLESRLDRQSLADWNTAAAGRTQSKALPDPRSDMRDVQVRPEKSDDGLGMKINQWAAETYPVAQKHLDTARQIENAIKKGPTD